MILILGRGIGTRRDDHVSSPGSRSPASRPSRSRRPAARLLLLGLLGLARCETPPAASPQAAATATAPAPTPVPAQTAAPAQQAVAADETAPAGDRPTLLNDPSAAANTPLCGQQARERNAIGAALQGSRVAASGVCAGLACYDPLTATYIGADGYRHVCR